ncbi:hypothetical protein MTR_8g087830 [Medicago truncatula]|uniref:Uncharacterized protein n=1 Tax=Medicago truncatula TaxID=3880 RepID=G7L7Z3_MEDTR|nr:hypothetical protein MTR_8g087830 [Medicago truncatula]
MLSDDDTIFNFSIWTAEAGGMWNLPLTPIPVVLSWQIWAILSGEFSHQKSETNSLKYEYRFRGLISSNKYF